MGHANDDIIKPGSRVGFLSSFSSYRSQPPIVYAEYIWTPPPKFYYFPSSIFYCLLQNFNNFLSPIILFPPPPPHFFFFYSLFALPSQSWFPSSTILLFSLLLIHLLISLYIFPPTNTSTSYRLYMDPTWTLDSTLCQHSFVNSETIYHHLHHRSIVFLPPPPHLYCFPPPPPINSSEVFFYCFVFLW